MRAAGVLFLSCWLAAQGAAAGDVAGVESLSVQAPAAAAELPAAPGAQPAGVAARRAPNLKLRNTLIIGSAATLSAAYGLSKWWDTGFDGRMKTTREGWFGSGTDYGGADKLGHLYSNYAGVRLLTPLFEAAGNGRQDSVKLAAWTTVGVFTGVEIADGYSRRWKFSHEDAIANVAGTLLGVTLETHPALDDKFDFRMAYRPSKPSHFDPFGDYSGQKYLLVAKADGFASLRHRGLLRYLEFAVGYGTRGFGDPGAVRRRNVYMGVSLNLARLLADGAYDGQMHSTPFQRGTDRLFELVQFPAGGYVRQSLD